MGKTEDGAVWIDHTKYSAYDYWQFWRNCDDADVNKFLALYTDLSLDEIENLDQDINERKKTLANYTTAIIHGQEQAQQAMQRAAHIFEHGVLDKLPEITVNSKDITDSITIYELLHMSQIMKSKGEARKTIRGMGVYLEGKVVDDELLSISSETLSQGVKISVGKKRHWIIKTI